MPELPEVETIKRVIGTQIHGLTIEHVAINRPEVISHPTAEEFTQRLTGQVIAGMTRRGKFFVIQFDSGCRLLIHLRMTGCLLLAPSEYPMEKHTHIAFGLSSGQELRFSDARRFGRLWLLYSDEADTYSGIEKLGIEPLSPELDAEYLSQRLSKSKRAIKECLMDQSVIAGIGNIYSDEILFTAKIHPARPACSLTENEWRRLAAAIPECLLFFICKNEISPAEYLAGKGKDYRNTPFLQVYGRDGKPCPNCGATLRRMVINQRSSVFCPQCQAGR